MHNRHFTALFALNQFNLTLLLCYCSVFDIDVDQCPHCGGQLKLIAAIEEPAVIERILTHLGLAAQPPPRTPARRVVLLQAA